jgi:hypothetical protein
MRQTRGWNEISNMGARSMALSRTRGVKHALIRICKCKRTTNSPRPLRVIQYGPRGGAPVRSRVPSMPTIAQVARCVEHGHPIIFLCVLQERYSKCSSLPPLVQDAHLACRGSVAGWLPMIGERLSESSNSDVLQGRKAA